MFPSYVETWATIVIWKNSSTVARETASYAGLSLKLGDILGLFILKRLLSGFV